MKNPIAAVAALALVALAPALATTPGWTDGTVLRRTAPSASTMSVSADSLMASTPLFDRLYLEAVCQYNAGNDSLSLSLLDQCERLNPEAAEVYYMQSLCQTDAGRDSVAIACLQRAAKLQPGNDTYQELVAETYIDERDYRRAIAAYEDLYSHHHDRSDVLRILVRLYGTQKDYNRMLQTIDRIEQVDGESDDLTFMRMNVYESRGDTKNAYNMLKSLVDGHPGEPSYRVMLGNWLMNHKRGDEAFAMFQAALKEDPANQFVLNSLYDYYRSAGNNTEADRLRDEILLSPQTDSKTRSLMLQQAIRESEQLHGGDSIPVLSLFDRTIAAAPKDADVINLKAMYMKLKKMPEDSVNATFAHTLAVEPDNTLARVSIIQNLWPRSKWDDVIRLSREGTQYNPDDMTFYYFLGMAYFQKDDDAQALDAFRRGVGEINQKSDPDIVADFYGMMGDLLYRQHRPDEAFAAYDSCLQWKPDNLPGLNNYAYYLSELNRDLKRAEQMSAKTVKAEPTNSTYLDTYAWILFLQKRYDEARAYIDRALDCDTDSVPSATVVEHAGDIYNMCGDTKRARELWQKAIDAGGDKATLERKIKKPLGNDNK